MRSVWAIVRVEQWHLLVPVQPWTTFELIDLPYALATSLESARALLPSGDRLLDPTYTQHWPSVLEVWVCGKVTL